VEGKANAQHQLALADHQAAVAKANEAASGKSGKKGKSKEAKALANNPPRPTPVGSAATHVEVLLTRVHLDLCRGCYLLLSALGRKGLLPPYDSEFMPLPRRFEQRFAAFRPLQRPPMLSAAHYEAEQERMLGTDPADMLASAASHFKTVKLRLDAPLKADPPKGADAAGFFSPAQRAEALGLVKVAVANGVLIATLNLRPPPEGACASFSFAAHAGYVVATLAPPKVAQGPKAE
jgi:hypothetical protein